MSKQTDLDNLRIMLRYKPLSINFKEEEPAVGNYIINTLKNGELDIDYKKSFIMFTRQQAFKCFSLYGLMNFYSQNISFKVLDVTLLLDVWYTNQCALYSKDDILNVPVLILRIVDIEPPSKFKSEALVELYRNRKMLGKVTWIYVEDSDESEFNEEYLGLCNEIPNVYVPDINF